MTRWARSLASLGAAERRVAMAIFLWGVGEGLWLYVRPLYIAELGGNPAQVGQVMGLIGLVPALMMLPAGYLSDRLGPRGLMISSWWVGLSGIVAMALAPDWQWLVPAALLYAVSAYAVPSINAYVAQAAHQRAASEGDANPTIHTTLTTVIAMYPAGLILSPLIGGWLGESFGLRTVFWVSAGWFALSTLVISGAPKPGRVPDAPATAAPGPVAPWWRLSAAQARIYLALVAMFFFMALGYTLLPNYLQDVRALSVGVINALGTAFAAGNMLWLLLLGRFRPRTGLVAAIGLVGMALAVLLYGSAAGWGPLTLIGVYFLMAAYNATRTLSLGVVNEHTPPARRGMNFGLVEMIYGLGAFVGGPLAGLLYSQTVALPFLAAMLALVPLMGLGWLAFRPPPTRLAGTAPVIAAPTPAEEVCVAAD